MLCKYKYRFILVCNVHTVIPYTINNNNNTRIYTVVDVKKLIIIYFTLYYIRKSDFKYTKRINDAMMTHPVRYILNIEVIDDDLANRRYNIINDRRV